MSQVDFEIPVSWGHISGVAYGKGSGLPVLCLHGILDNAGTFDRLIPLLPKRFFWVVIDLPGHGRSSHFGSGVPIEFTHLVYVIKTVIDHFKWSHLCLMGHSLGAQISCFFASLYPERVIKVIFLDGLLPMTTESEKYVKGLRKRFDDNYRLEASLALKTPPSYPYEDAVQRLLTNRPNFITPEAARVLAKRNLVGSGDGFRFSNDQRFKLLPLPLLPLASYITIISSIKSPCLLIIAEESLKKVNKGLSVIYYTKDAIEALNQLPNFSVKTIPGHHDVHLNDPGSVAALIVPFLDDTKSSL